MRSVRVAKEGSSPRLRAIRCPPSQAHWEAHAWRRTLILIPALRAAAEDNEAPRGVCRVQCAAAWFRGDFPTPSRVSRAGKVWGGIQFDLNTYYQVACPQGNLWDFRRRGGCSQPVQARISARPVSCRSGGLRCLPYCLLRAGEFSPALRGRPCSPVPCLLLLRCPCRSGVFRESEKVWRR